MPDRLAAAVGRSQASRNFGRNEGLMELGEAALMAAIVRSERDALAEAFRRHGSRVAGVARRICGADADDVVQDVFVRLWQRPEKFDPNRGSLGGFLSGLAHDRAIDVCRNAEARRAREKREASGRRGREDHTEGQAIANFEAERVRALLARLPVGEREAITLAYLRGLPYRQVAVVLGQPEGTIKTRIRSGLARLSDSLSSPAFDAERAAPPLSVLGP